MSKDSFEELTQILIQTQVLKALKDAPEYLDALVQASLSKEVDQNGSIPTHFSTTKMPWLTWCVHNVIQDATRKAVVECVNEMSDDIKTAARAALSSDDIVNAFAEKIVSGTQPHNLTITVNPKRHDD